jgi:hypothetical protein
MRFPFLLISLFVFLASGCGTQPTRKEVPFYTPTAPTSTVQPVVIPALTERPVIPTVMSCENWQSWPVIPVVNETAREWYRRGQMGGNHLHAFSKIGDGEISTAWFFTAFDLGEDYYDLGPYQDLSLTLEYFAGSFGRIGMAAKRGFNTERILDKAENDPAFCTAGESPLACELRLQRPAFALLSLGTNQVWQPDEFEAGMRQILDILISQNVVPILSTKGDNLEGDHRINKMIACLAQEYGVPLWNFWSAIQPLPNHGLQADLEHLTYGITDFDDNQALQSAWTRRNLTALQSLDAVWRAVTTQP